MSYLPFPTAACEQALKLARMVGDADVLTAVATSVLNAATARSYTAAEPDLRFLGHVTGRMQAAVLARHDAVVVFPRCRVEGGDRPMTAEARRQCEDAVRAAGAVKAALDHAWQAFVGGDEPIPEDMDRELAIRSAMRLRVVSKGA